MSSFLLSEQESVDRDGSEDRAGRTGFNRTGFNDGGVRWSQGQALVRPCLRTAAGGTSPANGVGVPRTSMVALVLSARCTEWRLTRSGRIDLAGTISGEWFAISPRNVELLVGRHSDALLLDSIHTGPPSNSSLS